MSVLWVQCAGYGFMLSVQLYVGGPVAQWPVRSCTELMTWQAAANLWAERSGIPAPRGPHSLCWVRDPIR